MDAATEISLLVTQSASTIEIKAGGGVPHCVVLTVEVDVC